MRIRNKNAPLNECGISYRWTGPWSSRRQKFSILPPLGQWTPIYIRIPIQIFRCEICISVTGTGYCLVSSIVWYSVCFMIEFDTHNVLCLVSSIVWYSVCFMIEFDTNDILCLVSGIVWYSVCFMIAFDTHDVLCLVSTIVWYSVCFSYCVKISCDPWYVLCNVSRLPFWESLWLLFTRLRLAWQVYLRPAILRT